LLQRGYRSRDGKSDEKVDENGRAAAEILARRPVLNPQGCFFRKDLGIDL
jgi:hypothetical protein